MFKRLKELAGVYLRDSARYRAAFAEQKPASEKNALWQQLCNRNETLEINPEGPGVRCSWRWTSDLHACSVRPVYAKRLAQRALLDFPVRFTDTPAVTEGPLRVSFIIAHEGTERIDHVVWTTRSILAQQHGRTECIVVDQSETPGIGDRLPASVRCIHRPLPSGLTGWRKAWAFNQGAREAGGEILVFHDGDILCPAAYGQSLLSEMTNHGAASIQRFLFNLSRAQTESMFRTGEWPVDIRPERVRQNWEGGTIAIRRDAFFDIGGYDEAFVGWGGEDNEFYNRCSNVGHLKFGFLPFIHLWHTPQADKHISDNRNITQALHERLKIPIVDRIEELKRRNFGDPQTPNPIRGYRDLVH